MTPRKLKIGIARYCYGGNGGIAMETPDIGDYLLRLYTETRNEPRIQSVVCARWADTPITATRNAACQWALDENIDVLLMLDSDMAPDLYRDVEPSAKPFFQSSFDRLYEHYDKGPLALFAPYCGPPWHPTRGGGENVYVFRWERDHTGHLSDIGYRLGQYSRTEAAMLSGIIEAGAGPTGLCMIDTRCLTQLLTPPYFEYEWEGDGPKCETCQQPHPGPRAKKASTEDVTFFRNLSLNGITKLGYNPVLCNWDAWAGHWKPWCVGKPEALKASDIHAQFVNAVQSNFREGEKLIRFEARPIPAPKAKATGLADLTYGLPGGVGAAREAASNNRVKELIASVKGNGHAQVGKADDAGTEGETSEGACGSPQEADFTG